jgi:Tfp pilus assembly protein PilX
VIDAANTVDGHRIGTGVGVAAAVRVGVGPAAGRTLLLNIVVLIVVGLLTLRFVRLLWRRSSNRRSRDA